LNFSLKVGKLPLNIINYLIKAIDIEGYSYWKLNVDFKYLFFLIYCLSIVKI